MEVLTLVHGRRPHLENLIRGLERSTVLPDALIIVQMNEEPEQWSGYRFPVISHVVRDVNGRLPLAWARNAAVERALGDNLIFLDVDCIPSRQLVERYRDRLRANEPVLLQGAVSYLPVGAVRDGWSEERLEHLGSLHHVHEEHCPDDDIPHQLFWSLNFACSRRTFETIGGFNAEYVGYGGEDTDFAFRARRSRVPVKAVSALAFHQYHPTFSPPLNHFMSIVANSEHFHEVWGEWPMGGWLAEFAAAGYLRIDRTRLVVLHVPTEEEILACLSSGTS
ncbi:glycosyltransferase family 2 protein [Paraburkholderia sp. BCC1886]|uniref:glycosyltransferase family 2 protein n=1 Tax=Paraburkholderia sp. BCC1886 TaxID=2562670 RepID=UPI001183E671|nr:galactosyltransferase-related protein [Paraburkholderia sp. BCC1886]